MMKIKGGGGEASLTKLAQSVKSIEECVYIRKDPTYI